MRRVLKVLLRILLVIVVILAIAATYTQLHGAFQKDYLKSNDAAQFENEFLIDGTDVSAHRMGGGIFPEDTMMAAKGLVADIAGGTYSVDIIEMDLWLTKDGELIVMHDDTFDRTTNSGEVFGVENAKPADYTLEELRLLNFAENFVAPDGSTPYKGLTGADIPKDVGVVQLQEILDYLTANGDFKYVIEIKDGGDRGIEAMDLLANTIKSYGLEEVTVLSSFHTEVLNYLDENYPQMHRHASMGEVVQFYLDFLLNKDISECDYKYDVFIQTPRYGIFSGTSEFGQKYGLLTLCTQGFINRAHEAGIGVYYWTVNDVATMQRLIDRNADGIITDYPNLIPQQ